MKNTEITKVQFLVDDLGEVFAFFPEIYFNLDLDSDLRRCYARIGQHSACSLEYTKTCRIATYLEFEPLLEELKNIGYNCKVILPTKKAFKELANYHQYGYGSNKHNVFYYDWQEETERGFFVGIAAHSQQVTKTDLLKEFYNYLFVDGIRPDFSRLKTSENGRFKVPVSLTF